MNVATVIVGLIKTTLALAACTGGLVCLTWLGAKDSKVSSESLRLRHLVKSRSAEQILLDIGLDDKAFDYLSDRTKNWDDESYKKCNYRPTIIRALENITVTGGVPEVSLDDYFPVYLYTANVTNEKEGVNAKYYDLTKSGMSPLFGILNGDLRNGSLGSLPRDHGLYKYWQTLTRAIAKFPEYKDTVYRGACLKKAWGQLTDWDQKVGQRMTTPSFVSLSRKLSIAKGYMKTQKIDIGESKESTSRILTIDLGKSTLKGYCIGKASMFPEEEEVLAGPGHKLTILAKSPRPDESEGHQNWTVDRRL